MLNQRVKKKLPIPALLAVPAGATALASFTRLFDPDLVESVYFRRTFPTISHISGVFADALPFSWVDLWIPAAAAILIYGVYRRQWGLMVGSTSVFYLWFFWGWGLNYHRPLLAARLRFEVRSPAAAEVEKFAEGAAREINRLWPLALQTPLDRETATMLASRRVEKVVLAIDGARWRSASRVKRSVLLGPWFRMAGVDGMFNPFGHEPLVTGDALPFELPFLMAHELAHVRGVANEGDANVIAFLATVASDDPRLQYSGWLYLWGYLRSPQDKRLDPGPRADLLAVAARIRAGEVQWVSRAQTALLDAHLKANAVPAGVRSYSEFVALAVASQPRWKDFR